MSDMKCDVLVVGAGIAGISAALTSAEKGCKNGLIESSHLIGGVLRSALLHELCGLYLNAEKQLNQGLTTEICKRLYEKDKQKSTQKGKVFILPFSNNLFSILKEMIGECENLQLMTLHKTTDIIVEKNSIQSVDVKSKNSSFKIFPKTVIDCSGNGAVLTQCNQKLEDLKNKQLSAISFKLNEDNGFDKVAALQVPYFLSKAVEAGKFPNYIKYTTATRGGTDNRLYIKVNIDRETCSYDEALDYVKKIHSCLKDNIPSLKKSVLGEISPSLSHREEARLRGKYILNERDVLEARKFDDGCVKSSWPVEFWNKETGPTFKYLEENEYYEIPKRCLEAESIENLYAAGRCISATPEALASARVSGVCIATGEQAAKLAFLNIQYRTRNIQLSMNKSGKI